MVERLLVVKLADVGDLLTATPALRALRERFPSARIDVLAPPHSAGVLRGLSSVDDLVLFRKGLYDSPWQALQPGALAEALRLARRLRTARYDAVLVLHHLVTRWGALKYALLALATGAPRRYGLDNGLGRAWFLTHRAPDEGFGGAHEVDYWLRVVDLLDVGASPSSQGQRAGARAHPRLEIAISPEDEEAASRLLGAGHRPTVAIHPGSGAFSLARRWPVDRFAAVADALAERRGARIVLVGGPDEVGLCVELAALLRRPPLNLAGKTTLKQLAAVIRRCDLFVGNDGGLMHLAVAAGRPVVAVFGLSNHRAWGPYGYEEWTGGGPHPAFGTPLSLSGTCGPLRGRWAGGEGHPLHLVVRADLPCSPCFYRGHSMGNRFGCATRDCLRLVTPDAVLAAAEAALDAWLL